jgi:hypothetical protein
MTAALCSWRSIEPEEAELVRNALTTAPHSPSSGVGCRARCHGRPGSGGGLPLSPLKQLQAAHLAVDNLVSNRVLAVRDGLQCGASWIGYMATNTRPYAYTEPETHK